MAFKHNVKSEHKKAFGWMCVRKKAVNKELIIVSVVFIQNVTRPLQPVQSSDLLHIFTIEICQAIYVIAVYH